MKTVNHTPGPWKIKKERSTQLRFTNILSKENNVICSVEPNIICIHNKIEKSRKEWNTKIANARLIVSAPEMFDILKDGLKYNIDYGCNKCVNNYRSEDCGYCEKMKRIIILEKITGKKIEEVLKDA